jgi:hypothetical protein
VVQTAKLVLTERTRFPWRGQRLDSVRASSSPTKTAEAWAFVFGNRDRQAQTSLSAPSSENVQGSMNLASNTAPSGSTRPSSVAAIHVCMGCGTRRWTSLMARRVLRSYPTPVEVLGDGAQLDDPFRKLSLARLADPYALMFRIE